jgi:predicted DNA-binding transcriptional regulator AlpA
MSTQAVSKRRSAPVACTLPPGLEGEVRLKVAQVCTLTGFGRSKLYEEIKAGRFPEPERSSKRCSRWRAGTVVEALNSRSSKGPN